ncbi:MAG TPA: ribosome biogenesis GTP-binding protein YihA/YsxC [Bdellovibrionales bacterium]|nr:ribosome biogenesis GTP-binding protein YihA/YsxC [Bdellovibrionales bacterium]
MKILFMKSAKVPKDYPFPYKPEIAVVGRSNAGKSSFINAFTGSKIAKVSATPGKTRLLQFFDLNDKIYMVDMPGYGFAKGNRDEVESWKLMIETYLEERETLKGVLLIMDIRREWSDEEEMLKQWFEHHDKKWAVVLNKADKLSRSAMLQKQKSLQKELGPNVPVFAVSSMKKQGVEEAKNLLLIEWPR